MVDLLISLSARDARDVEALARRHSEKIGLIAPVSVEDMATALLQAHLILIRDCGEILTGAGPKVKGPDAPRMAKIKGKGGVSLSGGAYANP